MNAMSVFRAITFRTWKKSIDNSKKHMSGSPFKQQSWCLNKSIELSFQCTPSQQAPTIKSHTVSWISEKWTGWNRLEKSSDGDWSEIYKILLGGEIWTMLLSQRKRKKDTITNFRWVKVCHKIKGKNLVLFTFSG